MNMYNFQSSPVQSSPVLDSVHNKVIIVTLIAPTGNYGNILQHYALQETVKSLGFSVDSMDCPIEELGLLRKAGRFAIKNIKRAVKLMLALIGVKKYREKFIAKLNDKGKTKASIYERKKLFQEFYAEYFGKIIHSTYRKALTHQISGMNEYNYVITGSDQVWNIEITKTLESLRYYYLQFVEREKRVNYAPSFGVSRLKFFERNIHKKLLQGFDRLSCREEEGCNIIKELTGREAQLVLDPTLLLTAEEWRRIARKPEYDLPENYVLVYVFSDIHKFMPYISELAEGLPVINIYDRSSRYFSRTGPREFVWLIDHADRVLTSSFHGTAFSVNFRKNFVSFNSGSGRFSRIRTLLSNLGLTERIFTPGRNIIRVPVNYDAVNEKLNALRENSMNFLRECLK